MDSVQLELPKLSTSTTEWFKGGLETEKNIADGYLAQWWTLLKPTVYGG